MILTEIGEVGVHVGDNVHILRPSLYAMTQIGPPAYIVEVYATVMAEGAYGRAKEIQFDCAHSVLLACSEEDITYLIGHYEHEPIFGGFKYVPGLIPKKEILLLAQCLIRHGVTGSVEPLPRDEGEEETEEAYTAEFDARKHVANAIAHLGMTEREAWGLTMTALVDALRAKFPLPPKEDGKNGKGKPPTVAEYDAAMEWADKIEAKRKLRLGIKD